MGRSSLVHLKLPLVVLKLALVVAAAVPAVAKAAQCRRRVVIFNFGDSNSDTGGLAAGLGIPIWLPEGRGFFRRSTGRLCDGRLVIDFLCESLNTKYLSPYLESLGSDFSNGANFAIAGSATLPRDRPFALAVQVRQFVRFKYRSLELVAQGAKNLSNQDGFQNALYTIDIGQNDLSIFFGANLPYDQIIAKIPSVISEIKDAIQAIYNQGGKNFWIHSTGPLGCLPQKLSLPRKDDSDIDQYGCLKSFNNASNELNTELSSLCDELRSELKNATIVYTDVYSIKYDLIANYTNYGFNASVMACCGYGGPPYNYNDKIQCGTTGMQVCPEGSKYISWDGVHYTEAANSLVASKILTTEYSKPKLPFGYFCSA